ncbi:YkyA family protein [Bacillus suaedaesalsae]|uniref:YkyA family protein n=1 Tax=Bacillus suaedaesalsae TaxID=2810349 RepID=A0ABS2DGI9_9BACI|nr:YkyA family protein [Bacillus suaedaesalsae]MBM6617604.1 YkyA family protein [Bacillus suaedaesalsae]
MKYRSIVFGIVLAITLSACQTGPLPQETIYSHLEQAVKLETGFENQQTEMIRLETKEKEIYDQIMTLGLKEIEKIKQLSTEALVITEERRTGLSTEYESMQQSKQEFEKIINIVEEVEEEQLKKSAKALVELMNTRYSTYEELYKAYGKSIEFDKELYIMFQNKDLTLEQLEEQIQKVNGSYESVLALNEKFNKITNEYNEKKRMFYEDAGLNITLEQTSN